MPRRIRPDLELALYRIAQESLSNARHHALATQVEVTLAFAPSEVWLTISDDGMGFQLPADLSALARSGHFGLMGMQERAQLVGAQLTLDTGVDQGTSVTATARLALCRCETGWRAHSCELRLAPTQWAYFNICCKNSFVRSCWGLL